MKTTNILLTYEEIMDLFMTDEPLNISFHKKVAQAYANQQVNKVLDDVMKSTLAFTSQSRVAPITLQELKEILESLKIKQS